MAAAPAQIGSIFAANPVRGLRGGNGWHVDTVLRDIAIIHHLISGAVAFSLEGATAFDGPGFCAHIIFLRSGELSIGQAGHNRTLSAGDIFVACAWQPLTFEGSDNLNALIIALPAWWAMQRFLDGFLILPDLYISKDYFAAPIIADLARTLFDPATGDENVASQGLTMIADLTRTRQDRVPATAQFHARRDACELDVLSRCSRFSQRRGICRVAGRIRSRAARATTA